MPATLLPFSAAHRDPVAIRPPVPHQQTGGALTGPASPRRGRPDDPADVLQSATVSALVRDLRRFGEALREPCEPARHAALRRHARVLLDDLDPNGQLTVRLRVAVDGWRSDAGRDPLRKAVLELETALAPGSDDEARPAVPAGPHSLLTARDRRATPARVWWLLDSLDQTDGETVEQLLTSPRWRLAKLLGRRRERQHRLLLWN